MSKPCWTGKQHGREGLATHWITPRNCWSDVSSETHRKSRRTKCIFHHFSVKQCFPDSVVRAAVVVVVVVVVMVVLLVVVVLVIVIVVVLYKTLLQAPFAPAGVGGQYTRYYTLLHSLYIYIYTYTYVYIYIYIYIVRILHIYIHIYIYIYTLYDIYIYMYLCVLKVVTGI